MPDRIAVTEDTPLMLATAAFAFPDRSINTDPARTLPSGHLLVRYASARTMLLRAAAQLGYVEP